MFKIDMHNHSSHSADSTLDPEEAIEKALSLGFDGMAFTDHNTYLSTEPVERLKEKYKGRFLIFRGAEYTADVGHVLLFGIKNDGFGGLGMNAPIADVTRFVKKEGGVIIIPHPFREWSLFRKDISTVADVTAIEACNGHNNEAENEKALRAAEALGLPTTGGSDAHNIEEVGWCYTEFFADALDYNNFLDVLREGRYRGVCR